MPRPTIRLAPVLAPVVLLAVSSCSAVGVMETSDPYRKLQQAHSLEQSGRLAVARRLIREATEIFEKKGDKPGLAEAYRSYAFYVRSNGEDALYRLRGTGRNAQPTNQDGRMDKAIVYFEKSLQIVTTLGRPDQAANLLLNIGVSHHFAGRTPQACAAFGRSLASHEEATRLKPGAKMDLPRGVKSFRELIENSKAEIKC